LAAARDVVLGLEMLAPKRSNGLSISPACANASRNSQIVGSIRHRILEFQIEKAA
jgi:hypothetical protein